MKPQSYRRMRPNERLQGLGWDAQRTLYWLCTLDGWYYWLGRPDECMPRTGTPGHTRKEIRTNLAGCEETVEVEVMGSVDSQGLYLGRLGELAEEVNMAGSHYVWERMPDELPDRIKAKILALAGILAERAKRRLTRALATPQQAEEVPF